MLDNLAKAWVFALIRDHPKTRTDDINVLVSLIDETLEQLGKPSPELEKNIADIISDARLTAYQDGVTGITAFRIGSMDFIKQLLALIVPREGD